MRLPVGSKVRFAEERQAYTVQASGNRYSVCTKPFNLRHTTLYTIIDHEEGVRGTENLIFSMGFETKKDCEEALERMEVGLEDGFKTEVSHRNRIKLNIVGAAI